MTNSLQGSEQVIEFIEEFKNVPRGTIDRMENFVQLLIKWNGKINLVGKSTERDIWSRHILDSAQLYKFLPSSSGTLIDIGSGAGLPGIILKILGFPEVSLVESDQRKCAFLHEAIRIADLKNILIENKRVEEIKDKKFDIITCRAFASLSDIFKLTSKFNKKESLNLFLKGSNVHNELDEASTKWIYDVELHPSITNKDSFVVAITNLRAKT